MLVVLSSIFAADTKITFVYDFVAPFRKQNHGKHVSTEVVTRRCSVKKFLKISQIHRKAPEPEALF